MTIKRDVNRIVTSGGITDDGSQTPVSLRVNPSTFRLKVETSGDSASYTDGDAAPTHPTGAIPVFNNGGTITAVSAANPLPVTATVSTVGLATSTKQSDGSQKTQIVDGSGNVIGATSNALDVNIKSGAGSGGTAMTDDAAFTVGTTSVTPIAGTYKSTRDAVDDNDGGALAMNAKRGLYTTIETPNSDTAMDDTLDALRTMLPNLVSSNNSSTATLLSGAAFTGTSDDVLGYNSVSIEAYSDQASATNGLSMQFSPDNSNWDDVKLASVSAATAKQVAVPVTARYFRIVYTNGGTNQASFRLQTMYHAVSLNPTLVDTSSDATGTSTIGLETRAKGQNFNGTTWDRARSVVNATNSVGTGIAAAGILGQFDDTSPTAITENSFGNIRISANRNAYTTIRDAAGNERGVNVNASNQMSVSVDNTVTVGSHAVTNAGTFAVQATLQTQTDTVMVGGVNIKEINAVTPLMGNGTTGTGSQRVTIASDNTPFPIKIDQTTPGTTNAISIAQIGGTTVVNGGTAGTQSVGGIVANNGTINSAVNPVLVGGQAVSSENTANTTAKLSQFVTDLVGKLIVLPYANPENFVSGAITSAMTGTTTTSLIAAPASGLRNYITQITVSNSHATVGTDVIIQDGSGGTTLYTIPAAALYGGAVLTFPTPLRQPTTATAIYCANVTTGASTKVSASGYKGI